MSYFKRGGEAFNLLKNNLVLFVPDLIYWGSFILLSLIFLQTTDLLTVIANNYSNVDVLREEFQKLITDFPILIKFLISLAVFIIINFVVGAGTLIWKLDMIKNLTKNNRINYKESLSNSKNYFFNVILTKIIIYFMVLAPLAVIIYVQVLSKLVPLTIFLLIILFLFYIYLVFSLFFIYPIIFLKTKNSVKSINESFYYFINNKKHTLYTLLIIILFAFVTSYVLSLISSFFSLAPESFAIILFIISYILNIIVNTALTNWRLIFIFKNYLKKD